MKLLSTAVAICLALSYLAITVEGVECNQDGLLLYEADLNTPSDNRIKMTTDTKLQGFSVEELKFSKRSQSAKAPCDWEGLIEITLPPDPPATGALPPGLPTIGGAQDRALRFEFSTQIQSTDSTYTSFRIVGLMIDNEEVDAPTHSVEIFNVGRTLKVYVNGELDKEEPGFIDLSSDIDTKIIVGQQFVKAYNGDRQLEISLDGVADHNTVYVDLNRLIEDQSPSGEGLCNVEVYAFTCST